MAALSKSLTTFCRSSWKFVSNAQSSAKMSSRNSIIHVATLELHFKAPEIEYTTILSESVLHHLEGITKHRSEDNAKQERGHDTFVIFSVRDWEPIGHTVIVRDASAIMPSWNDGAIPTTLGGHPASARIFQSPPRLTDSMQCFGEVYKHHEQVTIPCSELFLDLPSCEHPMPMVFTKKGYTSAIFFTFVLI